MSDWQPSGLVLDEERVEDTDLDGGVIGKPSQAMIYRVWTGPAAALEREQARAFNAARSAGWMLRPWGADAMRAIRSGVALTIDIDGPRLSVSLAAQ